jgi:MFS family permease
VVVSGASSIVRTPPSHVQNVQPAARPSSNELGPRYHKLWTASAIPTLGDGVFVTALPLLAAALSRDPLRVSLITFSGWPPWLLFGLVAGALVDRLDRRRLMWTVDAARSTIVAALGVAVLAGCWCCRCSATAPSTRPASRRRQPIRPANRDRLGYEPRST